MRAPLTWAEQAMVVGLLCLGGWTGLHASLPGTSVGVIWPPAGLALGFLLRWGARRLWPTLLAGSFLQTLLVQALVQPGAFAQHAARTAGVVAATTIATFLTPLLADYLVRPRLAPPGFRLRDAAAIFVWGGLIAQVASAVAGVGIFWLLGDMPTTEIGRAIFVWWSSNVTSVGLLAIWMATLVQRDTPLATRRPLYLYALVILATTLSFFLPEWLSLPEMHLELLVVFPVLMSAFALGMTGAATAALHCATVTLAGSLLGHGAFGHSTSFTALLSLQVYLLTVMGASLALGDTRRRWKEAQADLETSEAWFREIFHEVHDAVVVLAPAGAGEWRVERANDRAAGLLGLSTGAVLGALASGPLSDERRAATLALLAEQRVIEETWMLSLAGDSSRWVEGTLQDLRLGGGRRLLLVLRDVTDRKAAEAEGEQLRAQLMRAQKLEALGLLAAGIAHDFNNLLTAIRSFSDLLGVHPDPQVGRTVHRLNEVVDRGTALTRALVAFSRPGGTERRLVDLNLQVAECVHLVRGVVGSGVTVTFSPAPGVALLEANPGQLDQVLVNLACNARDAMPQGGSLHLATLLPPEEGSVVLEVRDTGCGMDEATRARIFEPFFTTKAEGKGTGLGLATVLTIVQEHQGSIRVDSTPGRGTTFAVRFPKHG